MAGSPLSAATPARAATLGTMEELPVLAGIDPVQVLNIDAAKASLDMVNVAYARTVANLRPVETPYQARVEILSDAWTIVDNAYRLRVLLRQAPGMKQRDERIRRALATFDQAEPLRHMVQHMNREIRITAASGRAIWGEVAFYRQGADGERTGHLIIRNPYVGGVVNYTVPAPPDDTDFSSGLGFVHLLARDDAVNLSAVAEAGELFTADLLAELTTALAELGEERNGEVLRLFS